MSHITHAADAHAHPQYLMALASYSIAQVGAYVVYLHLQYSS